MKESAYVHFRPEERPFVQKMEEWVDKVSTHHAPKRTDFLDPRQAHILQMIVNRYPDVHVEFYGGYEQAERKLASIVPDYISPSSEDFDISALSLHTGSHFIMNLDHGDYLGAVLGLGIKRDKIGDILVHETGCHLITVRDISDYVMMNLDKVHRAGVQIESLPLDKLTIPEQRLEELSFTVASLRLDAVASDAIRLSRAKILGPIQSGKVKLNWKVETDPSALISEGDVISIKGFGRFRVLEAVGPTKKGRIRIKIGKFQ